jgi:hypothetical protein
MWWKRLFLDLGQFCTSAQCIADSKSYAGRRAFAFANSNAYRQCHSAQSR